MAAPNPGPPERSQPSSIDHLDSWKEIAAYLKRSLRTVQRWEKQEGLPVHRHTHDKLGSVYAYPAELDDWWRDRHPRLEGVDTGTRANQRPRCSYRWLWPGRIVAVVVSTAVLLLTIGRVRTQPFDQFTITRLTSTGKASRAAISADGRYLAYVVGDLGQHSMRLRDLESGSDVQVLPPAAAIYGGISFSDDGKLIYYNVTKADETSASLYRIPFPRGTPQKIKERLNSPAALSPDGTRIAFVREDHEHQESVLFVAELKGSTERRLAAREFPAFLDYPAWSPSGKKIACTFVGPRTTFVQILEIDVASAAERPLSTQRWSYARQLKWLADGKGLVLSAREGPGTSSLWHVSYPAGKPRKITSDLDDFGAVSVTGDSGRIVTVQDKLVSSLWLSPADDLTRARQVADDPSRFSQASLAPDGSVVLEKQEGERRSIWVIQPDGNAQKRLTAEGNNYDPAVCPAGPFVVYTCEHGGRKGVCRINLDGSGQRQVVASSAGDVAARCSPDGRLVVYSTWSNGKWPTAWKVPIEGGAPEQLTDKLCSRPAISPDGHWIACLYAETPSAQSDANSIAMIPMAGGAPERIFPLPQTAYSRAGLRWTPDGSAIAYIDNRGGISNIWIQSLNGERRLLTDFRGDRIFYFEWSSDGCKLLFSRGTRSHDVFLIRDVR